jgi:SAM-dependent methyltransferase
LREEAYGVDIGQHSWVSADELRSDIRLLGLSPAIRLLDLGCGPGGPLVFLIAACGCLGTGIDLSAAAIKAARRRAESAGVAAKLALLRADLNRSLPLPDDSFDVAVSLDVILHVADRLAVLREIARVLKPGGRLLFTDAGVLTGPISSDEVAARGMYGSIQLCPSGFNEGALQENGFTLVATEDRTASLLRNASGRLSARAGHREELIALEGPGGFERQQHYLRSVVMLSQRGALARRMYLAELTR